MAFRFQRTGCASTQGSANDLPNGDWALGGWLRIAEHHGDAAPRILDQAASGLAAFSLGYYESEFVQADYRNRLSVLVRDVLGRESRIESSADYAASNAWQHVLVQRSDDVITLYVDGAADPITAIAGGAVVASRRNVFGALGVLEEAEWAQWDRALVAAEIRALAKGYSPRFFAKDRKWHFPMVRQVQELDVPLPASLVDAQVARHPRMLHPASPRIARTGVTPAAWRAPYRAAAGGLWHTGAAAGQLDVPGGRAGQTWFNG